ncbi:MAG: hypothetical protein K5640_04770 [Treponema sp.]|nr:hypothetical protein [Treponema sp.]
MISKTSNEQTKNELPPILFRLTRRCVIFFFLFLICTLLFYFSGNYQSFLDENQRKLLYLSTIVALVLAFFSFCFFCECVYYLLRRKDYKILYTVCLIISVIIFALSMLLAFFTDFIELLSQGL